MLIKDLSPELRELAVKNYITPDIGAYMEGVMPEDPSSIDVNSAFIFSESPEGLMFWWHVSIHGTAPESHPLHSKESKIE